MSDQLDIFGEPEPEPGPAPAKPKREWADEGDVDEKGYCHACSSAFCPHAAAWRRPDPGRVMDGRYHSDGPETERTAAHLVAPRSGSQRSRVLEMFRTFPTGLTDYELWSLGKIGARPHVPGTRREELIADGWPIHDSGRRRHTDTGSPAIVWVLEP